MATTWVGYSEEQLKTLAECRAYINSAPTPEERQRRKLQMYVHLYSCPQPLSTWLKQQKEKGS